jgi:hypothetical protein
MRNSGGLVYMKMALYDQFMGCAETLIAIANNSDAIAEIGEADAEGDILVADADKEPVWVAMSGAVAINSSGVTQIGAGAVDTAQIATDAVDSAEIKAGAVGSAELATDSVGSDEIIAGAVGFAELAAANIKEKIRFQVPSADTAGSDFEYSIGLPKHAGTVTSIKLIPNATFGADTNYSTLTVYNRGADDSGTTALCTNNFDAAHAATARVPFTFTLNGVPANLAVATTDVLTLVKTHTGDGAVVPMGVLEIEYNRTA